MLYQQRSNKPEVLKGSGREELINTVHTLIKIKRREFRSFWVVRHRKVWSKRRKKYKIARRETESFIHHD